MSSPAVKLPISEKNWPHMKGILAELAKPDNNETAISGILTDLYNASENPYVNPTDIHRTHFKGLGVLLNKHSLLLEEERRSLMDTTIPFVAQLILESKTTDLPISRQQEEFDVAIERRTVASLVAMGFLCLIRNRGKRYGILPMFSFSELFEQASSGKTDNIAKLKMIINYFNRLAQMNGDGPKGKIRFIRFVLKQKDTLTKNKLGDSHLPLIPLKVDNEKLIEDSGCTYLQVTQQFQYVNVLHIHSYITVG